MLLVPVLVLVPAGDGYKAAEGRKQRKNHLTELKGLLPPSHTPLLVTLLLEQRTLVAQPLAAAAASGGRQQQQQQGPAASRAGFSAAAQEAGEWLRCPCLMPVGSAAAMSVAVVKW